MSPNASPNASPQGTTDLNAAATWLPPASTRGRYRHHQWQHRHTLRRWGHPPSRFQCPDPDRRPARRCINAARGPASAGSSASSSSLNVGGNQQQQRLLQRHDRRRRQLPPHVADPLLQSRLDLPAARRIPPPTSTAAMPSAKALFRSDIAARAPLTPVPPAMSPAAIPWAIPTPPVPSPANTAAATA